MVSAMNRFALFLAIAVLLRPVDAATNAESRAVAESNQHAFRRV